MYPKLPLTCRCPYPLTGAAPTPRLPLESSVAFVEPSTLNCIAELDTDPASSTPILKFALFVWRVDVPELSVKLIPAPASEDVKVATVFVVPEFTAKALSVPTEVIFVCAAV